MPISSYALRGFSLLALCVAVPAAATSTPASPLEPGLYALDMTHVSSTKLPIGRSTSSTRSLLLAKVERRGDTLRQTHTTCDVTITGKPAFIVTTVPKPFIRSLPAVSYTVTLTPGSPTEAAWGYRADMGTSVVGWAGGHGEALPTSAADPRVVDQDGDGHPGVTVQVAAGVFGEGDVYVVQRSAASLVGKAGPDGVVRGAVKTRLLEQTVLDATQRLFARNPPDLTAEDAQSAFTMTRVPDGTTCANLTRPANWLAAE